MPKVASVRFLPCHGFDGRTSHFILLSQWRPQTPELSELLSFRLHEATPTPLWHDMARASALTAMRIAGEL
jgi:hypothetical protein